MVFSKKANIAQWKREAWYARAWFRPRKACAPEEIHAKQRPRGNWWRGNCQHVYYMSFLRRCNAKTFFFANIISSNLLLMLKSRTGSQKLKWILLWKHGPYDLAVCFNFPDYLFNLIWTAMLCVDCTELDRPHKNEKGWGCSGRRGLGCKKNRIFLRTRRATPSIFERQVWSEWLQKRRSRMGRDANTTRMRKTQLIPHSHQSLNMFESCLVKHGLNFFSL